MTATLLRLDDVIVQDPAGQARRVERYLLASALLTFGSPAFEPASDCLCRVPDGSDTLTWLGADLYRDAAGSPWRAAPAGAARAAQY
ncbi:hypothetical protein CEG14_17450 [Bordetella genomosp. 1]|uniref:Uncharacterized protein n=1 Tax=Bordetella genomosp. 1 TaxID=1395607 RepID=A0A261S6T3_9BORD|nr:hypothetical protein [Bordetella genomosp. 1]OZI32692.1 hypothetical protein CEG14_17450 [Bordetella genomosp. 1]OZI65953.1 hypothetical protein CAL27_13275 [Bordetella genomosp. 1]